MSRKSEWLEQERELLEAILADYESGSVTPDVAAKRIASIREHLAHVCRKLSELEMR